MDLKKLTVDQLRTLAKNARARGRMDIAKNVAIELADRGKANSDDLANIEWNQERVRIALAPFASVAGKIKANNRTPYTEAGGLRIGRRRGDPEWMWIDTYSAIKTNKGNAVFVCYVARPGSDPDFILRLNDNILGRYSASQLTDALVEWERIASQL